MGYVKWSYDTLNTFCHDVFRKFGFNEEETNIIKDVLLTADLYGIESHGMQRMVRYDKGIEKGTIHPDAKPEVVFETPVSAVIDGHDGMGQLISHFAMEKAIENRCWICICKKLQSFRYCRILCGNGFQTGLTWYGMYQLGSNHGTYLWTKSNAWFQSHCSGNAGRTLSIPF